MYIIQEIQTTNGVTALTTPETFATRNEADNSFFYKVSVASVSQVQIHAVLMYDEHGNVIDRKFYEHLGE